MSDPLPVELLATEDERRLDPNAQRCLDRIRRNVGDGGLRAFLSQPQPAFADMTGSELIRRQPGELLRRLDALEMGLIGEDEPEPSPIIPDREPGKMRKSHEVDRLLNILDELKGGAR